jgi:sirohydrochlorin cobaltochelatase
MTTPQAIILFAHGSRDPLWRAPIEAVAAAIAAKHPHIPVRCAYLELCAPDLATVTAELIAACAVKPWTNGQNSLKNDSEGASSSPSFRIIPMFLGMGVHARQDLPELVTQLRAEHPQVLFDVASPIGEDARVTALLAEIAVV